MLCALLLAPTRFLPAEDAVILFQYSRNLATHGAITYYAGGPHAEGATDFGWMVLLAAAMRAGIAPMVLTALLNAVSLCLMGVVLLRIARVPPTVMRVLAIAGCAGCVPQILAAVSGFAVLPEALLLTCLVASTLRQRIAWACVFALLLCLFRPDGVLFAVPLLLSLLAAPEGRRRRLGQIAGLFLLPGLLYFLWRVHYFGRLFPLPFLVKSNVSRFMGLFVPHSFFASLRYLLLLPVLFLPLRRHGCVRGSLVVSLILVPTLFYWAMRLDQNIGDRFFSYLPLAAAILVACCWQSLQQSHRNVLLLSGAGAFLVLLLGPLLREVRTFRDFQFRSVSAVADGLRQAPTRGTLLTSEAGYLAYGSGWIAYDAWGLNTAAFANHLIQPSDVARLHPDLIALHPHSPQDCVPGAGWPQHYANRSWDAMIRNVALGAQTSGDYQLWYLAYGSTFYRLRRHWRYGQGDQECFFLRRNSPDYSTMTTLLREQHAVPAGERRGTTSVVP